MPCANAHTASQNAMCTCSNKCWECRECYVYKDSITNACPSNCLSALIIENGYRKGHILSDSKACLKQLLWLC